MIPNRSLEQRRAALVRANAIRTARSALKRRLHDDHKLGRLLLVLRRREDELVLTDVAGERLTPPAGYLDTIKVHDLLTATAGIGKVKAHRILATVRVSHSKTLIGLTDRQRLELIELVTDAAAHRRIATNRRRIQTRTRSDHA